MDDELSRKLDSLLSSPDAMEKISGALASLGVSPLSEPPTDTAPNDSTELLSGLTNLAPLLGTLGGDDQNTALLKALRPYLHNGREKRLDESLKLLQLMKLLPLLKGGGLL